jgi:hypothetical protein
MVAARRRRPLLSAAPTLLAVAALAVCPAVSAARQRATGTLPSKGHPIGFAVFCHESTLAAQRLCVGRLAARAAQARPHVTADDATANPWLSYATSVNPGTAIQFVSPTVGWRVDGTYASPWMDNNLTSGPGGTTLTWPQPTVSKSTDGGHSWNVVRTESNGIWGIDFLRPDVGWVVGVTSLAATTDGGTTWQTLAEPSSDPLVSVQFISQKVGFGLTTAGALVQSSDGGASWQPSSLSAAGTALCVPGGGTGYVADASGNLFSTADDGTSWTKDQSSTIPGAYPQVWSELACDQTSVWHGIRIISPLLHEEAFALQYKGVASSSWNTLAANTAGGPGLSPAAASANGLDSLDGIASSDGHLVLAGLPMRGFAPGVATAALQSPTAAAASGPSTPTFPQLPASQSLNPLITDPGPYIRILGVSSVGQNSWMYVQDAAVNGTSPNFEVLVLESTDGGNSWTTVNDSGLQTQPQYN